MDELIQQLEKAAKPSKEAPPPKPPRGRRKFRFAIVILFCASLAAAGVGIYFHLKDQVSTDDAQVDGHIAPIAAKISGSVAEIMVDDNQQVRAGQVLVRIDARDYEARVAQARAALDFAVSQAAGARVSVPWTAETARSNTTGAEAQLAAANSDLLRTRLDYERLSSAELAFARANSDTQRATLERAQADLERMKPLLASDDVSKIQYDGYVAAARVAQSQYDAARERLAAAEQQALGAKAAFDTSRFRVEQARAGVDQSRANFRQVDIRHAEAASATAGIAQARANLLARELELSYTTIVSPISGVVTRKTVQIGEIVQPGQSLLTVIPLDDVWVTANFKETQLSNVRPGQRAEIHVDMYGRSFTGRVDSIAGATGTRLSLLPPENATGNYVKVVQRIPVKLVFEHLPAGVSFRPGMNVDATIFTK